MWQQPKQTGSPVIILISEIITASRAISMRYAPRPLPCGQTLNLRKWERIRHIRDYGFYADEINHFEANIDHVCVGTFPFNVGERQFYHDNGPFIDWQELNRIESRLPEDIQEYIRKGRRNQAPGIHT